MILKKSSTNENNWIESELKFCDGESVEIGIIELFCLLNFGCCLANNEKSNLLKRCLEIIEDYSNVEAIIKCQMEVNILKRMILTKNQRDRLEKNFKGLRLDNLEYSNGILDELEFNEERKESNVQSNFLTIN